MKNDEKIGRFLRATREISSKTTIFTEAPIIIGPKWNREDESIQFNCVGCFEPIRILNCTCPICHWPACSIECIGLASNDLHQIECAMLKGGKGPKDTTNIHSLHAYFRTDIILAIKILVMQIKNPKKFKTILEMESNEKLRKSSDNYKDAEEKIDFIEENYLKPLLKAEEKIGKTILSLKDRKTLHKIFGIIETNAMYISLSTGSEICGIYPTGCLMEHSCLPNCGYRFDMKNGFKIIVEAARDIKPEEHLTTTYSHVLWTTQLRQQHLKETKYFTCSCDRCKDPTELNTNFSTLRCIGTDENSCNGYHLPVDPLSLKTKWACNKCPVKVDNEQVNFIVGKMNDEVDNLQASQPTPNAVEDLIDKLSPFLHPSHQHMFALKHSLVQLIGGHKDSQIDKISESLLDKKLQLANELLKIVKILDPSSIRIPVYTAILLIEKHNALIELQRRKSDKSNNDEAKKLLEEALVVLRNEQDDFQGKQLYQKVENALLKF